MQNVGDLLICTILVIIGIDQNYFREHLNLNMWRTIRIPGILHALKEPIMIKKDVDNIVGIVILGGSVILYDYRRSVRHLKEEFVIHVDLE